jgi:hypothetical protein
MLIGSLTTLIFCNCAATSVLLQFGRHIILYKYLIHASREGIILREMKQRRRSCLTRAHDRVPGGQSGGWIGTRWIGLSMAKSALVMDAALAGALSSAHQREHTLVGW